MSRVILITGTSRGIGKALAEHYLRQGISIAGCSRSAGTIQHENYRHFEANVANEDDVKQVLRQVRQELGPVEVLINNAGVASMNHILTTPLQTFRKIMEVNLQGTFLFTRECAKQMMRQKSGRIVNFTSVARPLNLEGEAAYASSKAAVESFTRVAAREFAPFGITVNAVGFPPTKTDLVVGVPEEKMQRLLSQQPLPRFAEMEDIINATDFLISEKSSFITGQTLYLGGVSE